MGRLKLKNHATEVGGVCAVRRSVVGRLKLKDHATEVGGVLSFIELFLAFPT